MPARSGKAEIGDRRLFRGLHGCVLLSRMQRCKDCIFLESPESLVSP
jgi:hypothetical protein